MAELQHQQGDKIYSLPILEQPHLGMNLQQWLKN